MTPTWFTADSLDDLLRHVLDAIFERGEVVLPRKGRNRELRAVTLELTNPRARLSRSESRGKVFSALGELIWYLSGSNAIDQITHYIHDYAQYDEDGRAAGGYGPRLRGEADSLATVIRLLRDRPATRRAVIPLFHAADLLAPAKDVPCTCTLHFLAREAGLDLIVYMRSNDAFLGLPHDVFCFSMIQELVARAVGIDIGCYFHVVGSLHLYDTHETEARRFLGEGYYDTHPMPPMPAPSPLDAVAELCDVEAALRTGSDPFAVPLPSDPYWADLARLLLVHTLVRANRADGIDAVVNAMSSDVYNLHIRDRFEREPRDQ
jgi:thymidylate synthase